MSFGIDSCSICCNLIRWFDRLRCDRFGGSGHVGCGFWVLGVFGGVSEENLSVRGYLSVCLLFECSLNRFPVLLFSRALKIYL